MNQSILLKSFVIIALKPDYLIDNVIKKLSVIKRELKSMKLILIIKNNKE